MSKLILPINSLIDATWDYHRGGFYVGDVAFEFNPRFVYHFTCDISKNPSSAGLNIARIGRDKVTIKLAKPPVAQPPTGVSTTSFTANWTQEGTFTQYKFILWTDYAKRISHPNYSGILVTGDSLLVNVDVVPGMEYSLETCKDGVSLSLPSNRISVEEVSAATYLAAWVAAAYIIADSQETSGTDVDFENDGANGTLSGTVTLQQPGLFASYSDKSMLFNGGYLLKTTGSQNLGSIDWGVTFTWKFNSKSGDKWIGGFMSSTSNNPYAILRSGATGQNDGVLQMKNNTGSDVPGTGTHTTCLITVPNACDLQEHAIWYGVITISSVKHFIVLYRETTTVTKLADIVISGQTITIDRFVAGAAIRTTNDKFCHAWIQYPGYELATISEADATANLLKGVFA